MNTQGTTEGYSLNGEIEKLDGGYISNLEGKRKIYKFATDIDEAINIGDIIGKLEEKEYVINIELVPKYPIDVDIHITPENILQRAKEEGIIQVEKFNPYPNAPKEEDLDAPIVVTAKNAYSSGKLSSIDWKKYHEELPMSVSEKALICNFNKVSMYGLSKKLIDGNAKFHLTGTRIAATILAKFYERNLGVRHSHKDKLEMISTEILGVLRDLELTVSKSNHYSGKDVSLAVGKIRKMLL